MLTRFFAILGAKINWLLGKAEKPDEMLDYSYEQQLVLLQDVKRGIADLVTAKQRLMMQVATAHTNSDKLTDQARQALAQGREDLARRALDRKSVITANLADLESSVEDLTAKQEKLVDNEKNLRDRIESFRTQKEVMKAEYSAAEAQVKISESATGISRGLGDASQSIGRAKARVEDMQARALALDELVQNGTFDDQFGEDTLDRELGTMKRKQLVEADLAMLKESVPALPSSS